MSSNSEPAEEPSADALLAAVGGLLDRSLTPLSDNQTVEVLRGVERAARMLAAVQHKVLIEVDERSIPALSGAKTIKRFLMETLRLSAGEAGARVHAAAWVGEFHDLNGAAREPGLPRTAAALRRGDISVEHARGITTVMKKVPRGVSAEDREAAEDVLAQFATASSPDDIGKVGDRLLAHLDPDGTLTDDTDRARMRGIRIGRQRPDGMSPIAGEITPTLRALLDPVLAKYARPGVGNPEDPTSPGADIDHTDPAVITAAAQRDTRTAAQRNHDALALLLSELVDVDRLGVHRGMPVSTVLSMNLDDLEDLSGVATTATGGTVPISEALALAEKSRFYLGLFDHAGVPLHFGRMRRLASAEQRLALLAGSRGCSRPGCDAPASLCQVHHVTEFGKDGCTDIENLVLACDHCHGLVNDGPNGWKTVTLDKDSQYPGRTAWIAPWHIDPTGTPRVNHRHRPGELLAQAVAALRARKEREREEHKEWLRQHYGDTAA